MKSTDFDDFFDRRQSPLDCRIFDGHGIINQSSAEFLTVDFVSTPIKIHRNSDKRPWKSASNVLVRNLKLKWATELLNLGI